MTEIAALEARVARLNERLFSMQPVDPRKKDHYPDRRFQLQLRAQGSPYRSERVELVLCTSAGTEWGYQTAVPAVSLIEMTRWLDGFELGLSFR